MDKVWGRKIWTLSGRLNRKILAHRLGVLANTLLKNKSLQFEYVICVYSHVYKKRLKLPQQTHNYSNNN
jgi:hypothetical protein